ncbi:sigma factor SigB regulation protein RsbQ [Massilia eurypsychrophila]|jgi:sigma-B regulation protein RsbQ|uniref:Sigma factor SigB regulation protein RsbQ n=1 Tax=Massilia eurypsychrophila TaxID=1485217 RepID=A0A2G8T8B3_9BURK|nr:alpha/beta hydrolase [Massilia eurypsychrophila]PIL42281.1 sigma factor SigB regulation protein RsbQ [Massilia eurypsychrophila]
MQDILDRNRVTIKGNTGPTMIYAHGFGCNQAMWQQITSEFGDYRQVLFDYTGSGAGGVPFDARRYSSLDGYVQDLLDVCDALGLSEGVRFVGHSVSCSIGLLASIARPALFERMVMIGPSPCFLNCPPDYYGGFEREDLAGLLDMMEQNYVGWAQYLAPIVAGAEQAHATGAQLATSFCSTDPLAAKTFARATFFADNRADLAAVTVPSLLLQHRRDALAPLTVGDYLHAHLANSRLQVLDVSGHCAHMSHPDLVVAAMRRYLSLAPASLVTQPR